MRSPFPRLVIPSTQIVARFVRATKCMRVHVDGRQDRDLGMSFLLAFRVCVLCDVASWVLSTFSDITNIGEETYLVVSWSLSLARTDWLVWYSEAR